MKKNVGDIPYEVPVPNSAHTLVSACHKRRNIHSHWLTTCYGLHQKTLLVSIRPHIGAPANDALHCQLSLASGHSLGRDWRHPSRSLDRPLRPTPQRHWNDPSLPTSGDRPFCGAMVEWPHSPSWLCDDDSGTKNQFLTISLLLLALGNHRVYLHKPYIARNWYPWATFCCCYW